MQTTKAPNVFFYLLLVAAPLLLYGNFLWNPLVFDDEQFFIPTKEIIQSFSPFNPRSLPLATILWTKELLGDDLLYFRTGNLILHITNSILIFIFLRKLFETSLPQSIKNKKKLIWIAFFSGLIYALHPVAVYAAGYLIQRTILMTTLFGLLMLLSYLHGLTKSHRRWLITSALFYFLAVFSKEHSVMLPGVALAMTLVIYKPSISLAKRILIPFFLFTIIALIITLKVKGILGATYEPFASEMLSHIGTHQEHAYPLSIFTQTYLFFKYIFLWALPSPAWMSIDMREPLAAHVFSWPYFAGAVGFMVYACIGLKLLLKRGHRGLLGFAMLFPWILFLTEFATIRVQEPFVLYRSYLWSIGMLAALPFLFIKLPLNKIIITLIVVTILLIPLSWNRLDSLSHPLKLWNDAAILAEKKPQTQGLERIYHNRGYAYLSLDMHNEAIQDFNKALSINPKFYFSHFSRGRAFYELKQYENALQDFNQHITLAPNSVLGYRGRGHSLEALGHISEAQQSFQIGCALKDKKSCEIISTDPSDLTKGAKKH